MYDVERNEKDKNILTIIAGISVILLVGFFLFFDVFSKDVSAQTLGSVNYSDKNLAIPYDLKSKEYQDDGVYFLSNVRRIDTYYDVINGVFHWKSQNTSETSNNDKMISFEDLEPGQYTITVEYLDFGDGLVGGRSTAHFRDDNGVVVSIPYNNSDKRSATINISNKTQGLYLYTWIPGYNIIDFTLRVQIEKGSQETQYSAPLELYLWQVNKLGLTNLNVNIIEPALDMSNDVWLDGNMVSDVYYRVGIIYNDIIYDFLEDIEQAYIDGVIPGNTLFYIELSPMYNFIQAKFENQGNGLYWWTENGTLDPEKPNDIKTIIIHKNGVKFGMWSYLWDDFASGNNVKGNAFIGYENETALNYYDYNNGYQDGHWAGSQYGFGEGRKYGYNEGRDEFGQFFEAGSPDGFNGWYGYQDGYDYGLEIGFSDGYDYGFELNTSNDFSSMISSILLGVGTVLGIELLPNITIGAIIAVPIVFGIIAFVLGRKKE